MKKIGLLLVFGLLLGILASCGEKPDTEKPTETEQESAEPSILVTLPTTDLKGEEFVIMGFSGTDLVIYDADQTGTKVGEVSFARTAFVNRLLNTEIRMNVLSNPTKTYDTIVQNHLGGGSDFMLAMPHPTEGMAATLTGGYCADLLSVQNLSLDGTWYHQTQVENYQTNGKLYLISSDFTVAGEGIMALVFHKGLYSTLGGGLDLYQTVKDGDWTLDVFLEEVKKLDATGKTDEQTHGTYAMAVNRASWEGSLMYASDIQTVRRDSENQYVLNINQSNVTSKIDKLLEVVYELAHDTPTVYYTDRPYYNVDLPNSDFLSMFLGQRVVFMPWDVGSQYGLLRERSFEIGYLPLPKYDVYQTEYRTICAAGMTVIPSVLPAEKREQSATVLEALARYSYLYTRPAFFSTVIGGRLSEGPADYDMLALIQDSKYYDIGNAFDAGSVMRGIIYTLAVQQKTKTCSTYMKQKTPIMGLILEDINAID